MLVLVPNTSKFYADLPFSLRLPTGDRVCVLFPKSNILLSSVSSRVWVFSPPLPIFLYLYTEVIVKVLSRESTLIDPGDLHAFPGRRYVTLRTLFRAGDRERWLFEFSYV